MCRSMRSRRGVQRSRGARTLSDRFERQGRGDRRRRLRPHRRRAAEPARDGAAAGQRPADHRVWLRRRSRSHQAAVDGRGGRTAERSHHRHVRQPAQRGSQEIIEEIQRGITPDTRRDSGQLLLSIVDRREAIAKAAAKVLRRPQVIVSDMAQVIEQGFLDDVFYSRGKPSSLASGPANDFPAPGAPETMTTPRMPSACQTHCLAPAAGCEMWRRRCGPPPHHGFPSLTSRWVLEVGRTGLDETLFAGAAAYYVQGRPPYAEGLADALREALALDETADCSTSVAAQES